jgi:hypothetical protein
MLAVAGLGAWLLAHIARASMDQDLRGVGTFIEGKMTNASAFLAPGTGVPDALSVPMITVRLPSCSATPRPEEVVIDDHVATIADLINALDPHPRLGRGGDDGLQPR